VDLALYRVVGGMKRVALAELATGVEFFTAAKDDATGVITLTPVKIVDGTTRQPSGTVLPDGEDLIPQEE
jgi:hypothetical protein